MNKKLLVGMFSTFMALAPWSGYAAQTIDAPHRTVDSTNLATEDDCTSCHFTNYDVTLPEGTCGRCHKANTPPYGDTIAPVVMTHKNLKCQACHNPHVSLQASGLAGAFTGVTYDAVNNKSTLTGVSPTPDASWAAKTGAERGMILWVTDGADNVSYEVKAIDAAANTVTVSGNVTASPGAFDLRRGQLIAKKVSKTVGNSYRQGDLAVQFPSSGSTSIFIDTVNATPTGVCQVCHTTTAHWTSNGAGSNHNANRVCTECHTHDTGFLVTACNACHQGVGLDGVPVDVPGLAQPPTGSVTAGQHQIHAVDYAMECTTCHVGTGMDRINNPTNPVTDGKIQIGISTTTYPQGYLTTYDGQTGVTYEGTNHTTVTNTGTMSCGTVYCHSNGHSIRMNCATAITNSSLKWDGSSPDPQGDAIKCNNCHGFRTAYTNPMVSARHIGPHSGYDCYYCHADTVDATNAISAGGRANHANGVYNVKAGGTFTFTYDPTTKKCSAGGCHGPYTTAWTGPSTTYPSGYTDPETCPDQCAGDGSLNADPVSVSFTAEQISSNTVRFTSVATDSDANDPIKAGCRGGGHSGLLPGQMRLSRTTGGKFVGVPYYNGLPMVNDWVLNDPAQIDYTNPAQPVFWFHRIYIDNDLDSLGNLDPRKTYKSTDPAVTAHDGLIYGFTDGIAWSSAFQNIAWNSNFDDSNVNVLAWPTVTPTVQNLGGGSYKMTLTSGIVDPDCIDAAKNTKWPNGHNGTVKTRIKAYWGGGTTFTVHRGLCADNTSPIQMETPMTYTFTNKATGSQLWYYVQAFDSHRESATANAALPTAISESGWNYVLAP